MPKFDIDKLGLGKSTLDAIEKVPNLKDFIEAWSSDHVAWKLFAKEGKLPSPEAFVVDYIDEKSGDVTKLNVISLCAQLGLYEHVNFLYRNAKEEDRLKILSDSSQFNFMRALQTSESSKVGLKCTAFDQLLSMSDNAGLSSLAHNARELSR